MLLKNKIVLITGATRGIGLATAKLFASEGATLVLSGRNNERLDAAMSAIRLVTPDADLMPLELDVSVQGSISTAFQTLFKEKKRLDILVNNAGILESALIGMATPEHIQTQFAVNTFGPIYCAQYASRLMSRHPEGGSIINLHSIIGTNGNPGQSVYSASKAALGGFTQSLAKELAAKQIRVNAIAPGLIDTDMGNDMDASTLEKVRSSIAMGRIGKPEDVAKVALFLASDLSSYVTGQIIGVDGGMLI